MGLRITDWPHGRKSNEPSLPLSEEIAVDTLKQTAKQWPYGRIARHPSAESEFLEKYIRIRKQLPNTSDIVDMASQIESRIRKAYVSETGCHSRVDIATLLELL